MTRPIRRAVVLAAVVLVCSAHIGSPDAWYEGPAGPYGVLVHVEAPPVVPGIAVVNVRAGEAGIDSVTAFVNRFDATGAAPPPDVAERVAGSPGWYRVRLWVMTAGSNSVTVAVHGAKGDGSVVVPLVAVSARRLGFGGWRTALMVVVGLFLASGLVTIIGASVRESVLTPGVEPDASRRRRARRAMVRAVVVLALVVVATGAWWRAEDASFARSLYRSLTVATTVEPGVPRRFTLAITDSSWIRRNDIAWLRARGLPQRSELIEDHGSLVHLFLIAADGRSAFAHLHPSTTDTVGFTTTLPPLPGGRYSVFADVVHASGLTETLSSTVDLADPAPAADSSGTSWQADSADSWALGRSGDGQRAVLDDGSTITWLRGDAALVAREEAGLRFLLAGPDGSSAALEPYLGMAGHAVVVRDDAGVFIHLHPLGTISVAAQMRLVHSAPGTATVHMMPAPVAPGDTLYFPYAFPQPGRYTVWVQIKRGGRILTGSFPVAVGRARNENR